MTIPQEIVQKMRNLQIVSNRIRFLILVALYNSQVFKYGHSQTFSELKDVLDVSNSDLGYHINLLLKSRLVIKKEVCSSGDVKHTYYNLSKEGKRLLNLFGLTEKRIKGIGKAAGVA
jgi:DNA-binding HxlR family transcriptional regulator